MKTNLIRRIAVACCLLFCICIYSCKKDVSSTNGTTSDNVSTTSDDQQQVSTESDNISNDANTALNGQSDFSGSLSGSMSVSANTSVNDVNGTNGASGLINVHQLICDATVTYDTAGGQRIITIVYDGTNCWGNRTRSETVCSPFCNVAVGTVGISSSCSNHDSVVVCKHTLFGNVPCFLGSIFKINHEATLDGMCNCLQRSQVFQ